MGSEYRDSVKSCMTEPAKIRVDSIGEQVCEMVGRIGNAALETASRVEERLSAILKCDSEGGKIPCNEVIEEWPEYFSRLRTDIDYIEEGLRRINAALDRVQL